MNDRHAVSPSPGGMPCSQARTDPNFDLIAARAKRVFAYKAGSFTVAAVLVGLFSSLAQAQTLAPVWNQQSPTSLPTARFGTTLAYDAGHSQVVMFGGFTNAGDVNDTWLWNGTNWTSVTPSSGSPSARSNQTMVYDAAQGQVVMFGGSTTPPDFDQVADTWLWNGTTWTQVTGLSTSPPARSSAAMAYDAATGQVVLFGGMGTSHGDLGDTWIWNGSSWTSGASGPSARHGAAMAYDAALGEVILFGGDSGGAEESDTWAWNGTSWTQLSPSGTPPGRDSAAMAYDATLGEVVLFGGENVSTVTSYLNDTWVLSGTTVNNLTWTQQTTAPVPGARDANAMAYDAAQSQVVMFGGYSNTSVTVTYGDTWTWGTSQSFGNINVCPSGAIHAGAVQHYSNADLQRLHDHGFRHSPGRDARRNRPQFSAGRGQHLCR